MPNIFDYTNYREYLKVAFAEMKKKISGFSHRRLAAKLELSTPNFILLVMQGKRNMSASTCFKLSKILKHTAKEARYFQSMVNFLQTEAHAEKDRDFKDMMALRQKLNLGKIEELQYDYYSTWYNPVIRELVLCPQFNGDSRFLARKTSPPITEGQAKRSVELLLQLGMIKKRGDRYVQADPIISTGPEVNSLAVQNYHRATAQLAAESYDRHIRKERTITSCTIAITEDSFEQLKGEIADLRRKALILAQETPAAGRVYQLNIQLFPVSRTCE